MNITNFNFDFYLVGIQKERNTSYEQEQNFIETNRDRKSVKGTRQ